MSALWAGACSWAQCVLIRLLMANRYAAAVASPNGTENASLHANTQIKLNSELTAD